MAIIGTCLYTTFYCVETQISVGVTLYRSTSPLEVAFPGFYAESPGSNSGNIWKVGIDGVVTELLNGSNTECVNDTPTVSYTYNAQRAACPTNLNNLSQQNQIYKAASDEYGYITANQELVQNKYYRPVSSSPGSGSAYKCGTRHTGVIPIDKFIENVAPGSESDSSTSACNWVPLIDN